MNFEEAYSKMTFLDLPESKDDSINRFYHKRTWETCKKQILKLLEEEFDKHGNFATALKKVREEI